MRLIVEDGYSEVFVDIVLSFDELEDIQHGEFVQKEAYLGQKLINVVIALEGFYNYEEKTTEG